MTTPAVPSMPTFELPTLGNDSTLMFAVVGLGLVILIAAYIIATVNNRHPLVDFKIKEGGVLKKVKYRLYNSKMVVPNSIIPLLFGQPTTMGSDIGLYAIENVVEKSSAVFFLPFIKVDKYKKYYLGNLSGGLLVRHDETLTEEHAVASKAVIERSVIIAKKTREIAEQTDPLRSEVIKIIPVAVVFFFMGLIILAGMNEMTKAQVQVAQFNKEAAAHNLEVAQIMYYVKYGKAYDTTTLPPLDTEKPSGA